MVKNNKNNRSNLPKMQLGGNSLESPRCSWALILETPQRASIRECDQGNQKRNAPRFFFISLIVFPVDALPIASCGVSRITAQLHLGDSKELPPNCILGILKNFRPTASWAGSIYYIIFTIISIKIHYFKKKLFFVTINPRRERTHLTRA